MNGYRILLVDDDRLNHKILGDYLALAGYALLHAYNGSEGLDMMRDRRPDLVLLDVQMPVMDGFQVMERLRGEPWGEELPVIFLTSLDRVNLKVKGLELGAEDYLVKSVHNAELLARIKGVLRRSDRFRRIAGTLQGDLADISLPELLQTLELGRKSARIDLPAMDGSILLDCGLLALARQGDQRGTEALNRLFFLNRGPFTTLFSPPVDPNDRGERFNLQHLIMDAATVTDETRRLLTSFPAGNPLLVPVTPSAAGFAPWLPAPLDEVLVRCPEPLPIGANRLVTALHNHDIGVAAA